MKLWIDGDRCVGHGRCYELAPGLIGDDEFGHGRVVVEMMEGEEAARARLAVAGCPEHAVYLDDQ